MSMFDSRWGYLNSSFVFKKKDEKMMRGGIPKDEGTTKEEKRSQHIDLIQEEEEEEKRGMVYIEKGLKKEQTKRRRKKKKSIERRRDDEQSDLTEVSDEDLISYMNMNTTKKRKVGIYEPLPMGQWMPPKGKKDIKRIVKPPTENARKKKKPAKIADVKVPDLEETQISSDEINIINKKEKKNNIVVDITNDDPPPLEIPDDIKYLIYDEARPSFSSKHRINKIRFYDYYFKYFHRSEYETEKIDLSFKCSKTVVSSVIEKERKLTEEELKTFFRYLSEEGDLIESSNIFYVPMEREYTREKMEASRDRFYRHVTSLLYKILGMEELPQREPVIDDTQLMKIATIVYMNCKSSKKIKDIPFYKTEERRLKRELCEIELIKDIGLLKNSSCPLPHEVIDQLINAMIESLGSDGFKLRKYYSGWYVMGKIGLKIKKKLEDFHSLPTNKNKDFFIFYPIYLTYGTKSMKELLVNKQRKSLQGGHFTFLCFKVNPKKKTFVSTHFDSINIKDTPAFDLIQDVYNYLGNPLKVFVGLKEKKPLYFRDLNWQRDPHNCAYFVGYLALSIMTNPVKWTHLHKEKDMPFSPTHKFYFHIAKKMILETLFLDVNLSQIS